MNRLGRHVLAAYYNDARVSILYPGLISFYQDYLSARVHFLKQYQERIQGDSVDLVPPRWLRLRQRSTLDTWLDAYRRPDGAIDIGLQPLPIPRNLLYPPILVMVADAMGITSAALCEEGTQRFPRIDQDVAIRPSVTWLLKRYLAQRGESAQEMYRYARRHDLFDTYLDKRVGKQIFKPKPVHFLIELERKAHLGEIRASLSDPPDHTTAEKLTKLLRIYKQQERSIRHTMAQDMLLYLYARSYLNDRILLSESAQAPAWSLEEIEHTLLNTPIRYQLAVPATARGIIHTGCKVRNLGEMRLLARDKRLPSLLAYYPDAQSTLDQAEVRAELASYRRVRVAAMEKVHRLERTIATALPVTGEVQVPEPLVQSSGTAKHGTMLFRLYDLFHRHADRQRETPGVDDGAFAAARFDHPRRDGAFAAGRGIRPVPNVYSVAVRWYESADPEKTFQTGRMPRPASCMSVRAWHAATSASAGRTEPASGGKRSSSANSMGGYGWVMAGISAIMGPSANPLIRPLVGGGRNALAVPPFRCSARRVRCADGCWRCGAPASRRPAGADRSARRTLRGLIGRVRQAGRGMSHQPRRDGAFPVPNAYSLANRRGEARAHQVIRDCKHSR